MRKKIKNIFLKQEEGQRLAYKFAMVIALTYSNVTI